MVKEGNHEPVHQACTRRQFLETSVASVAGVVAVGALQMPAADTTPVHGRMSEVHLRINGHEHKLLLESRATLLSALRDVLGMTGTKLGCGRGECGACTLLIDDMPHYSCLTLAVEAQGHEITTIEGLVQAGKLGPVQQAFLEHDAFQCGYCTPGQVMAAEGLLRRNTNPTIEDIREGMCGNLCRCGAYVHICRAVVRAAELKRGTGP
jgi:xanthine dehydrogenase YagT iron-sulfur-binding subunit